VVHVKQILVFIHMDQNINIPGGNKIALILTKKHTRRNRRVGS